MKFFTLRLLVNRLLTLSLTLSVSLFSANASAFTAGESILTITSQVYTGIEYASLTATATDKSVFINWVTASEQNNSHFEVERSTDMKVFTTVAMVLDGFSATGTAGKSYKFKEAAGDVKKGKTVYYRLKQVDNDNQVHYSQVMAVQMNTTVTVFPKTEVSSSTTNNIASETVAAQNVYTNDQILLSTQTVIKTGL
jgi:hypothetical protein